MFFFELLTWVGFGLFLGIFKLYLTRDATRSMQARTVLLGAGGGLGGGLIGWLVAGSLMSIGGYSVIALLLAGAAAVTLLILEPTVRSRPR